MQYTFTIVVPSSHKEIVESIRVEKNPNGQYEAKVFTYWPERNKREVTPHVVYVAEDNDR